MGEGRGPGPQRLSFLQVEKGGFSFPGEAPACGQAPRLKGPGLCGSRRVILSPRPSPEMGGLLILYLSSFLIEAFIAINFPLSIIHCILQILMSCIFVII